VKRILENLRRKGGVPIFGLQRDNFFVENDVML
jgi:hypothetical protein